MIATQPRLYASIFVALLVTLGLSGATSAFGQGPLFSTNVDFEGARGLITNNAFFSGSDIDTINTNNGNLVVKIPIGQRIQIGPSFSYGLDLFCNSNAWDSFTEPNEGAPFRLSVPVFGSNAGIGCQVSLGMMYPRNALISGAENHWPNRSNSPWVWVAPDGSKVYFKCRGASGGGCNGLDGWFYSDNGTFLRLDAEHAAGRLTLAFPDGRITELRPTAFGCPSGECWRPVRMADAFGNAVTVTYNDTLANPTWTLHDTDNRVSYVRFAVGSAAGGGTDETGDLKMVVREVELPAINGTRAVYGFEYQSKTIPRLCPIPDTLDAPISVPFLTKVQMPLAGYRYRLVYYQPAPGGTGACSPVAGLVKAVELPSHTKIGYTYGNYFSPSSCTDLDDPHEPLPADEQIVTSGVVNRAVYKNQSDFPHTPHSWETFSQRLEEREYPPNNVDIVDCNRDNLSVTDVVSFPAIDEVDTTYRVVRHYHTVSRNGRNNPTTGPWGPGYYGLPIHLGRSTTNDFGGPIYLSKEIASCGEPRFDPAGCTVERETWLRYAIKPKACGLYLDDPSCFRDEAVVMAERQVYADKHIDTRFFDYDGYGHFKRTRTKSDMPSSNTRDTLTHYTANPGTLAINGSGEIQGPLPLPPTSAPWLLGLFDRQETTLDNKRRVEERQLDPTNGFLLCQRTRQSTAANDFDNQRGGHDVIVRFTPTNDGRGFVGLEEWAGGDDRAVGTNAICTASGFQYGLRHTYRHGRNASTRYELPGGAPIGPYVVDHTIDPNTGFITAQRDHHAVPMLETAFGFDVLGRSVSVEAQHRTDVTYTLGGSQSLVSVVTTDGGEQLSRLDFTFNELGQEVRSKASTESGRVQQVKTYHRHGGLASESSLQPVAGFEPNYKRRYPSYDLHGHVTWVDDSNLGSSSQIRFNHFAGAIHRTAERRFAPHLGAGQPWLKTETRRDAYNRRVQVDEGSFPQPADPTRVRTASYSFNQTKRTLQTPSGSAAQTRKTWTDGRGFAYKEQLPELDGVRTATFDARGNLLTVAEGGVVTTRVYDGAERLVRVNRGATVLEERFYDHRGNLEQAIRYNHLDAQTTFGYTNAFVSTLGTAFSVAVEDTFSYNDLGLIATKATEIRVVDGPILRRAHQGWHYDALGRITETDYPVCTVGCNAGSPRTVTRDRSFGFLDTISLGAGASAQVLVDHDYHANGLPKKISFYRAGNLESWDEIDTEESGLGRIKGIRIHDSFGAVLLSTGEYHYDSLGHIATIAGSGGARIYHYDTLDRLKTVAAPGNTLHSYTYDVFDNLLRSDTGQAIQVDAATNRLATSEGAEYDARGNVVRWGRHYMSWDALGRQLAWSSDLPTEAGSWQYQAIHIYDAAGRRVMVLDRTRDVAGPDNDVSAQILTVHDLDGQPLRDFRAIERRPAGTGFDTTTKDYFWAGRSLRAIDDDGELSFAHLDHLGSVRAMTWGNAPGQRTLEHFRPFGEKITRTSDQRIGFTGHVLNRNGDAHDPPDQERDGLGLTYHMKAREYLPQLGRFLSADPARAGWNLYTYASNDPVNRVDPSGLLDRALSEEITVDGEAPLATPKNQREQVRLLREEFGSLDAALAAAESMGFTFGAGSGDPEIQTNLASIGEAAPGVRALEIGVAVASAPVIVAGAGAIPGAAAAGAAIARTANVRLGLASAVGPTTSALLNDGKISSAELTGIAAASLVGAFKVPGLSAAEQRGLRGFVTAVVTHRNLTSENP